MLMILQKMQQLRADADASSAKADELAAKVKTLEQENLAKEQEITSLTHKNQTMEAELEDLHGRHNDLKKEVDQSGHQGTQNEALQRRLQILEEEAEEADKSLRETNDKYVLSVLWVSTMLTSHGMVDSARPMSRLVISNAKFKLSNQRAINGRRSMRKCQRSTRRLRKNLKTWRLRLGISEGSKMSLRSSLEPAGFT